MTQIQIILVIIHIMVAIGLGGIYINLSTFASTHEWFSLSPIQRVFVIVCLLFWPVTILTLAVWYFFFSEGD